MKRMLTFISLLFILIAISIASPPADKKVTVRFIAPAETNRETKIYLAGNLEQFGDWKPDGALLTNSGPHEWKKLFHIKSGTHIEFKITQGSWETEAVYKKGAKASNTVVDVAGDTTITLRAVAWGMNERKAVGQITGTVRYHKNLMGDGLRYPRDVIVWLPPSYATSSDRRYPVLYMHDGQNIIDPKTSYTGYDWSADEVADSLIRAGAMREIIIVGIYNSADRMSEYRDTTAGVAYGRFVVGHLKPMIDSLYRTLPDAKNTAIMGSSLGGTISFLFAWWYPDVFGQAACLSTVFRPAYTSVLDTVRTYNGTKKPIRIYMDCGGAGGDETLKPDIDAMHALLLAKGFINEKEMSVFFDSTAVHNEKAWAARVWRPLLFLFPIEKF